MDESEPTSMEIAAWIRLMRVSRTVLAAIEGELRGAGLPALGWYDVLLELERAGEDGLRPRTLQDRLLLAQYNLSRLVDRMERAGLIRRQPCPADARGQVLTLTAAGRGMRAEIWPVYRQALLTHFVDRLDAGEIAELARILERLGDTATGSASAPLPALR